MKKKLINFRELSEVLNKRELKNVMGGSVSLECGKGDGHLDYFCNEGQACIYSIFDFHGYCGMVDYGYKTICECLSFD